MTPEPTPVVGTWNGENRLVVRPSEVIVTTDSRAAATTAVMSVSPASVPVVTVRAFDAEAGEAAVGVPATFAWSTAAVPVEARTAERRLTPTTPAAPRSRAREVVTPTS